MALSLPPIPSSSSSSSPINYELVQPSAFQTLARPPGAAPVTTAARTQNARTAASLETCHARSDQVIIVLPVLPTGVHDKRRCSCHLLRTT